LFFGASICFKVDIPGIYCIDQVCFLADVVVVVVVVGVAADDDASAKTAGARSRSYRGKTFQKYPGIKKLSY
jgi:hypothetical protein